MQFDATLGFKARPHQLNLLKKLKRTNFIEWHRRSGKTYFARWYMVQSAILKPNTNYLYLFPSKKQMDAVTWSEIKEMALKVPGTHIDNQDHIITFPNKSTIRLDGVAFIENFRGDGLHGLIMDETGSFPNLKKAWESVLSPMLITGDSKGSFEGWAIFIGTPPESRSHYYYTLRRFAQANKNWYFSRLSALESGALTKDWLDEQKHMLDEETFNREYLCLDAQGSSSAYFGTQLRACAFAGKIGEVEYNPNYPVLTGWDIGRDGTAIWFAQLINKELYFIDYYEKLKHNESIQPFIQYLVSKPYTYAKHYLPADASRTTMQGQKTTSCQDAFEEVFGADCVKIVPKTPNNGKMAVVEATRRVFHRFFFDDTKCAKGLDALRNYRPKLDALGYTTKNEMHDDASHGGTAFMTITNNVDFENDLFTFRGLNRGWFDDEIEQFSPVYITD